MKKLLIILMFIPMGLSGQTYYPKNYNEFRGMWIPATIMSATSFTIYQMNLSPEYSPGHPMHHIRDRQRFTMFITGVAVSATSIFIIEKVNKKYYKRRGIVRR